MDKDTAPGILAGVAIIAFLRGLLTGRLITHAEWRTEAAKIGTGQYNHTTGKFEWKPINPTEGD